MNPFARTMPEALAVAHQQGVFWAHALLAECPTSDARFALAAYIEHNPDTWWRTYDFASLRDRVSLPLWHRHGRAIVSTCHQAVATAVFALVDAC